MKRVKENSPPRGVNFYWAGEDFEGKFKLVLYHEKRGRVLLAVEKGEKRIGIWFTKKEFPSLICEVVKYFLALPEVARKIPFYESCAISRNKLHGAFPEDAKMIGKDDRGYIFKVGRAMELSRRYHGLKRGDKIVWWEEDDGMWLSSPLKSKARIIQDIKRPWKGKKVIYTEAI